MVGATATSGFGCAVSPARLDPSLGENYLTLTSTRRLR
jgi:hypothetical protein